MFIVQMYCNNIFHSWNNMFSIHVCLTFNIPNYNNRCYHILIFLWSTKRIFLLQVGCSYLFNLTISIQFFKGMMFLVRVQHWAMLSKYIYHCSYIIFLIKATIYNIIMHWHIFLLQLLIRYCFCLWYPHGVLK